MVEMALVIIPLFAFVFLLVDIAWIVFAQSTLQAAVRSGVRYAVTCQIAAGQTGLDGSIRQVVRQGSMGFITSGNAASLISIKYFDPTTLAQLTGSASNPTGAGNIIEVSVTGLNVNSFGPIMRSATPVHLSATASDIMESSGGSATCPE
jgi:Flp pilus assembly protein TadG